MGTDLQNLFRRIEESRVGVAILSEKYTESSWCLDELVKMMEQREKSKLVVIPIFFRLDASKCKLLLGAFGDNFRILEEKKRSEPEKIQKWKDALASVFQKSGMTLDSGSDESKFVDSIVENVKKVLIKISIEERVNSTNLSGEDIGTFADKTFTEEREEPADTVPRFGVEKRLKQLEEKLQFHHEKTRIVGVVGMPGMGKSTIAKRFYEKWQHQFESRMFFPDVSNMSRKYGFDWLQKRLIQELLKDIHPNIGYSENAHEFWKDDLLQRKVLVVLDDVTGKKQIKLLLGECDWIKKGSKIVITSSDESLLRDLVDDTYVLPRLNSRDSIMYLSSHALDSDHCEDENFLKLLRNFLNYAKGNPLALGAFGAELHGEDEAYWKERIETMTEEKPNKMVDHVLRRRYDELTERQKDVLLVVACFFRSENASFVRSLVDDSDSDDVCGEIGHLQDKFLLEISNDRVEIHNILCTFAKGLASKALAENTGVQWRLWNHVDLMRVLKNKLEMENVRGVFLDTSKVPEEMSFDANIFSSMCNLLYLKIHSSAFTQRGKTDFIISVPKEFQLPLDEVRYLHWLRFPLEKLPSDFNATNLVNLELPHSKIKQVWEGFKDAPKLKWVDLSYSHKLNNLSGLSNAKNLERLNLEGCRSLVSLPQEMENMKSLVFLNMRSCKRLRFLPLIKLSSLKILILTDCSKLEEFEVISENLEALYLDGTAVKGLPPATGDLERLTILNLKGCEMLESLPESLGKQKALEELILSGCSKLESVPKDVQNMRYLRILLLDGTRVKEMPNVYSLQRLCLSRNNAMTGLQGNICHFEHLKWIELKNCKSITYLPTLPPNLEWFNAHGCERLEAVGNPLADRMMTEQIRSTFVFTNCNNLEQDERNVISSYAQWKCHRLALECYDRGIVSGASFNVFFPGFDVPSWFQHQEVGSVLEPRLQPRWWNNRLSGIALCAVVSFCDNQDPVDGFSVQCILQFKNEDGSSSSISFDFDVGCLTESERIDSDHVFIRYESCSAIIKRLEDQFSGNSIPTEASLEFYVSDKESSVVNCGLSLVYAEPHNVPVEANHYRSFSKKDDKWFDTLLGCMFVAFFFVPIFAPHYYLKFYNYCWPLLAFFICAGAGGLFMEWLNGKPL